MPDKKTAKKKILNAKREAAKETKSILNFSILFTMDDKDGGPHWLFGLLVLILIALIISVIWEMLSVGSSVQAYLPYL